MKVLAVLPLIMLAGCVATMPQQGLRPTMDSDPTSSCFDNLQSQQSLQILAEKTTIAGLPSLEMMASKDKPTEEEKKALSAWAKARQACTALGRDYRIRFGPPGFANVIEWQQSAIHEAIAGLYGDVLTYGQFNVERTRIATAATAQLRDAANRNSAARAQQAQQNAATAARESREYQDRLNSIMQMQIQQMQTNKPITTDCTRFGNSINCTTR